MSTEYGYVIKAEISSAKDEKFNGEWYLYNLKEQALSCTKYMSRNINRADLFKDVPHDDLLKWLYAAEYYIADTDIHKNNTKFHIPSGLLKLTIMKVSRSTNIICTIK